MEREIQYPDFLTPEGKRKEKIQKGISKLKIYRKTLGLLALGIGIGLAAPKANATIKEAVRISIEKDNEAFAAEVKKNAEDVFEMTGYTPEEMLKRAKDPEYDFRKQEEFEEERKRELERIKTDDEKQADIIYGMYEENHKDDMEPDVGRTR